MKRVPDSALEPLVRSVTLRDDNYMLFLGAGTSVTSGVPSAQDCIWRWKRLLYVTAHPKINPVLFGSASLPHVQEKIQNWLDRQGVHPALGADEEYAHYAEACFPLSSDRKTEFRQLLQASRPHIGYRLLGLLIEAAKFRWIWTTNFDDLVDRGRPADRNRVLVQAGMDTAHRLSTMQLGGGEVVQVFLHGDYRYDSLRNTANELRELDCGLREKLIEAVKSKPLLVVGYSGRDASVMDALTKAYSTKAADLYWCAMDGARVSPDVQKLISTAKDAGNNAKIVDFDGFDDLMERLARVWLTDAKQQAEVEQILQAVRLSSSFTIAESNAPDNNWLLGNAFEIELPRKAFEISGVDIPNEHSWQWLRERTASFNVSAGLHNGLIIAIGQRSDIERCFERSRIKEVEMQPGGHLDDSALHAALLGAIVSSLQGSLERIGACTLATKTPSYLRYQNRDTAYFDSVHLSLERVRGKDYLALELDIEVGDELGDDERKAFKREVLWRQRNHEYFEKLKWWKALLFPTPDAYAFTFPKSANGSGVRFRVHRSGPVSARIMSSRPRPVDQQLSASMARFERFSAITMDEPYLNFNSGKSIHPIRGLAENGGPFDTGDATFLRDDSVQIGVICTTGYERRMQSLIASLSQRRRVGRSEADREYLVDYPGFESAFNCPLNTPSTPSDERWRAIPKIEAKENPSKSFDAIVSAVRRAVDELTASERLDVLLIHVPPEWREAETITDSSGFRDLHDHIKAVCIHRGIRSQLVREEKLSLTNEARLNWWLALALYAKAMRTPWSLDHPMKNVAYVGIGYSYVGEASDEPVVLGCSHVFDSRGFGLRFRLGKLRDPIWRRTGLKRRKNPFMTRDDAALLGNRTRQLFYEIHQELPERILVTKRTPFLRSERDGLLSALADVANVDLVTVEHDDSWRFCAYNPRKKSAHGFPVKRGSVVLLDAQKFLLWLHGSVMEVVADGMTYYQGKSRIPTPVRVTRYAGTSDLDVIATDLLALTKMDWNTFALYKKMPVTVTSPNVIARIGRLLPSSTAESYDYRLFM